MKRRSRLNVGQWPNMRDDTLKVIADELMRARKKHPAKEGNVALLGICVNSLIEELTANDQGRIAATQVYARAAQVAALAVRVLEEGGGNYRYAGNTLAPAFKLEAE